jgi:hypothetical protein
MNRALPITLGLIVSLTGCTAVSVDLQGAQTRAHAAQAQGLLGPNDPLPACLDYFVGAAGAITAPGSALKPPFAGVVDFGVEGYILDALTQAGGVSDTLDKQCGGVAMKILKNAGRRLPGL